MSTSNEPTLLAVSDTIENTASSSGVKSNDSAHSSDKATNANVLTNQNEVILGSKSNANLKMKPTLSNCGSISSNKDSNNNRDTVFTLKKWNLVAMWSWDVECEVCAICRTPLMGNFCHFKLSKILSSKLK